MLLVDHVRIKSCHCFPTTGGYVFKEVIVILVCIGLSGCSTNITNIGDIQANPQNYLNKEVTVEGTCVVSGIMDDNQHVLVYQYSSMLTGRYRLTGIIKSYPYTTNCYLEVTKAESI